MNKYLVSVDIEGITGVIDRSFADPTGANYSTARRYMTHDVNAVVRGILAEDPSAQVLVRDAHHGATNLNLETLHPKAHLIQGWNDVPNMVWPVDKTFKGVFLVGYHAGGNNNQAVLAHALSGTIHSIKINNKIFNEAGVNGLYAGHFDVPVAFISGDDYAIAEAKEQFKNIEGVIVKKSYGRDCGLSVSLEEAAKLLETGAKKATKQLLQNKFSPLKLQPSLRVSVRLNNVGYGISIFQKVSAILSFDKAYSFDNEDFCIQYTAKTAIEAFHRLNLILMLIMAFKRN